MKIVCLSDTHNFHKGLRVPDGDLLIHAGDGTGTGSFKEAAAFLTWLDSLPHAHKVLVAGNHDFLFERDPDIAKLILHDHPGITYLQDSGFEIDGIRIWGSPWSPWFMDWAFNLPRNGQAIREKWNLIPMDTDILVTHGPPHGTLDQVRMTPLGLWDSSEGSMSGPLGCEELRIRVQTIKPALHVFGHIHDGYGLTESKETVFINASICTEAYKPTNPPIVVDVARKANRLLM